MPKIAIQIPENWDTHFEEVTEWQEKTAAADQPEEAPDGKCWAVHWADHRAIVCFRKKSHAQTFYDSGKGHSWFEEVYDGPKLIDNRRLGKNGQVLKGQKYKIRNTSTTFKCSGDDCSHPSHKGSQKTAECSPWEAIGWAHAWACNLLDAGRDPRQELVPDMMEQAEQDLDLQRVQKTALDTRGFIAGFMHRGEDDTGEAPAGPISPKLPFEYSHRLFKKRYAPRFAALAKPEALEAAEHQGVAAGWRRPQKTPVLMQGYLNAKRRADKAAGIFQNREEQLQDMLSRARKNLLTRIGG